MTEKTGIEKRRDDLIEAISLQSQIDWRTAESIADQVEHLDNVLCSCSELHLSATRTEFIAISRPH